MIPVSEFNFVLCGIATIAASVGYACSRRLSSTSASPSLPDHGLLPPDPDLDSKSSYVLSANGAKGQNEDIEAVPPEKTSFDPSTEIAEVQSPDINASYSTEALAVVEERPSLKRKQMHDHDENNIAEGSPHNPDMAYPNKRSKTPPIDEKTTVNEVLNQEPAVEPKKDNTIHDAAARPAPMVLSRPAPVYPPNFSGGFASFAGSSSPFASTGPKSQNPKPVWATGTTGGPNDGPPVSAVEDKGSGDIEEQSLPVMAKAISSHEQVKNLTGEEDEEVESELKGIKLFIKRGKREFSTGMLGHAKLLVNKGEGAAKRRIVFRREPLWKVSMNVFLQPVVRCSFDEQECILRIILKEPLEDTPSMSGIPNITIYALKPGRSCSRQHFKDFAALVVGTSEAQTEESLSQSEP